MSVDSHRELASAWSRADPTAFAPVPAGLAGSIGLWTQMGVRFELAILSGCAHDHRLSMLDDRSWSERILDAPAVRADAALSEALTLAPGEFWSSQARMARNLASRWRFAVSAEGVYDGPFGISEFEMGFGPRRRKPLSTSNFEVFRKAVQYSVRRLIDAKHLRLLRHVQFAGKREGSLGSVYTVGQELAELGPAPYSLASPDSLLLHPRAHDIAFEEVLATTGDEWVNVVDIVGPAFLAHRVFKDLPDGSASTRDYMKRASPLALSTPYRAAESRRSLLRPGRTVSVPGWNRKQARLGPSGDRGPDAERHTSVGAWKAPSTGPKPRRSDEAYIVPWLPLDFDRDNDFEAACEASQRAVKELLRVGVDPSGLLCCPTGGRGVHVFVACGLFGTPLYQSLESAKVALRRTVDALVDEDVDEAVLSPIHLIRAVGSGYHNHPRGMSDAEASMLQPQAFKVVIPTEAFVSMPVAAVLAATKEFAPFKLPDPRRATPVPALVSVAHRAGWRPTSRASKKPGRKPASVIAVEGGVGRGERNNAAFVLATYLADQGNMEEAAVLEELEKWNTRNVPPMGSDELAMVSARASAYVRSKAARKDR